jgi:cellobiose-specific phosphotransferase system component IIA
MQTVGNLARVLVFENLAKLHKQADVASDSMSKAHRAHHKTIQGTGSTATGEMFQSETPEAEMCFDMKRCI